MTKKNMFVNFAQLLEPLGILMFTSSPGKSEEIVYSKMNNVEFYYGSLKKEMYETLLLEKGFKIVLYKENDVSCGSRTIWITQKM